MQASEYNQNINAAKTSICTGAVSYGLLTLAPVAAPGIALGTILGGTIGAMFGYATDEWFRCEHLVSVKVPNNPNKDVAI